MRTTLNLKGQKFGKLTCIEFFGLSKNQHTVWHCICECGNKINVVGSSLKKGLTKSCGCFRVERASKLNLTHGLSGTYWHWLWIRIRQKCTDPAHHEYKYYGGRGILLYKEWERDFETFYQYLIKTLGKRPSKKHSLDRIDTNKNYEPGNLRWATYSTQRINQRPRSSRKSKYQGVRISGNKFSAKITWNYKNIYLGTFPTQEEAARAYNKKAMELHGSIPECNKGV